MVVGAPGFGVSEFRGSERFFSGNCKRTDRRTTTSLRLLTRHTSVRPRAAPVLPLVILLFSGLGTWEGPPAPAARNSGALSDFLRVIATQTDRRTKPCLRLSTKHTSMHQRAAKLPALVFVFVLGLGTWDGPLAFAARNSGALSVFLQVIAKVLTVALRLQKN